ncbi:ABC transporter ATP-binding protein [Sulfitobacter sp. F26204]|uniref:ABC transporter ATP-binding protein n=1 Tax=Sulfitobacter sp. F26204 TaxID=2996014 RepID=UPI00225E6CD0|nr:ABC transporter ATP-binding protein [Sulfitobacter sp. F26204]MCX7561291.1 ABC transporter ATP-binding protein [Sulfitobacter sp. F26204]
MSDTTSVIDVRNLDVVYHTANGPAKALFNIDMTISAGERIGLVGESGCGKSTLLKTIMGVLPPNGEVTCGAIHLGSTDLLKLSEDARRKTRWAEISMITQSALNALNPVKRIDAQIIEAVRAHREISKADGKALVAKLFEMVGVSPERAHDYPHQFSGGMRQRAVIAMALALEPKVIIADEPTTALDVIVQDQIFTRLRALQIERGFSMILVTHDIALVVENCGRICVMYAGMIVETGETHDIVRRPRHPYTIGLLNAVSVLGSTKEPIAIPGSPPNLFDKLEGCRFAPRCPLASALCHGQVPPATPLDNGHSVRCHHWEQADEFARRASDPNVWGTAVQSETT